MSSFAIYDRLTPDWRQAPLRAGTAGFVVRSHDDTKPSLDIHEGHGGWICRAGCGSGSAVDFARRLLGEDGKRALLRELGDHLDGSYVRAHAPQTDRACDSDPDPKIAARSNGRGLTTVADDGTARG